MTIRNIKKNLAGMEDLLQGLGTEEQARGNSTYTLGKVDVPYAVDSLAKMTALDITLWTRARVYTDATTFVDYIFDPSASSGVAPDAGAGYWILNRTKVLAFDTLALAVANTGLSAGDTISLKERTTGNGGGAMWDAVPSSTVTENTYDIVQCTGAPTLSLVLRVGHILELDQMGFLADETTDNSAAMNRAIVIIGEKLRIVRFPVGGGLFTNITIPTTLQGAIFEGCGVAVTGGITGSKIRNNGTTPMFKTTAGGTLSNITFRNLSFHQTAITSGDIFEFLSSVNMLNIEEAYFSLLNTTASFLKISAVSISNVTIEKVSGAMATGSSDSAIDLIALVGGNMFNITHDTVFINASDTSAAPIIRMEDTTGGSTSFGIVFRSTTLELAGNGGGIHLYSIRNPTFTNVIADDAGANAAPIILLEASAVASSRDPFGSTFIGCWMKDGTSGFPDIKVTPGAVGTQTTLIGCEIGYVDTGIKPFVNISSLVDNRVGSTDDIKLFSGGITIPAGGFFSFQSNIKVPEIQVGETSVITTGSFEDVTFPLPFTSTPKVIVSHVGTSDKGGEAQVSAETTTGMRIHNFGTGSTTIAWNATNPTTP